MSQVLDELNKLFEDVTRREAEGEYLARLACEHYGVTWAELTAKTKRRGYRKRFGGGIVKTRRIVKVRRIAVQLLRGHDPPNALYSFPAIARILGLKNHTSVLYAFRAVGNVPLTVEDLRNERGRCDV